MILTLGTTPAVQRTMTFGRLTLDDVNRAVRTADHPAGKAVNAAKVAATLGEPVTALGFVGGDGGRLIRRALDVGGVGHAFVDVAPPTRTCVTLLDLAGQTTTELVEESAAVEPADYERLYDSLVSRLPGAAVLVLSGTLAPLTVTGRPPTDFYARCVSAANAAGVATVLDAKGEPLRLAAAERPTVVKPNAAELADTAGTGGPLDTRDALRSAVQALLAAGPAWAVITRGPQPAVASDGRQFWSIAPPRVNVVNPIGSGDAVAAGIAVGLSRKMAAPDAVRLGLACGAANATTDGPGMVERGEVERLLARIESGPLDHRAVDAACP